MTFSNDLTEQLAFHWRVQLRPRLDGLTDAEYFWEPVPGSWNVRRRSDSTADFKPGSGEWTCDFVDPEPVPAPVTTIAWRLAHLNVGVLGERLASHFGGPAVSYPSYAYEGTAAEALAHLDERYEQWLAGIKSWSDADLAAPIGPAEGAWADASRAALVLHISREIIHHGAEICLLRDLYAHGAAGAGRG